MNMYMKMELLEKIREVLHHFGGEDTIQLFRSGCLGHFVDFRGGNIARKTMHALVCREGKKMAIQVLYDKFTAKRLANHPPDYVKLANILIVYQMLFCQDPERAIDDWVWTLVDDVDGWNSFPWGLHISDDDALYQHPPESATGYGPTGPRGVSLVQICLGISGI
ncbi:hypothetical protein C2S51_028935 [Perilla frutescens var. frutescens]|nr:hypothetical protein C2S51_028935 [Perilla frutescens var. frutescens]